MWNICGTNIYGRLCGILFMENVSNICGTNMCGKMCGIFVEDQNMWINSFYIYPGFIDTQTSVSEYLCTNTNMYV